MQVNFQNAPNEDWPMWKSLVDFLVQDKHATQVYHAGMHCEAAPVPQWDSSDDMLARAKDQAVLEQNFERAARIRDLIDDLKACDL